MFLLDTNVVSELRKLSSGRADPRVVAWNAQTILETTFISVISLAELETGVSRMERRDASQGAHLRRWLEAQVLLAFRDRILAVDQAIARRCGQLRADNPHPEYDALIAATALVCGLTVVTRNVADFAPMGVPIVNPWDVSS